MVKLKKSIMGKYNAGDVDRLLLKVREDYEQCLKNQKDRILMLREENKKLFEELAAYKNNEQCILNAITHAEETAHEIIITAKAKASKYIEDAQTKMQNISAAFDCNHKRLCGLKEASEAICKALDEATKKQGTNVRPFTGSYEKLQMY